MNNNAFPGYEYVNGKNMYRGTDLGKGGYIYAEPGVYRNVALLDVQSLHPNSIIQMNTFGEYTQRFKDILDARVLIKHKRFDEAREMLDGKLAKYLDDESVAKSLAQALKIAINSVYGLTSASFDNPFRDQRNVNNIVALRGALFMRTLQDEVVNKGYKVMSIRTDSIKIPDSDPEIIKFCTDFAAKYGYIFEHEATYDRICLINDADYIAKYSDDESINGKDAGSWTATGAQFQRPYVFKTLFSKEPIEFEDLCETKSVAKGELYLDFNENLGEDEHNYTFVGRVGQFTPMMDGTNAGILYRYAEGKYYAATGTKGYRWMESEVVKSLGLQDKVDKKYHEQLVNTAVEAIEEYCGIDEFVD